MAQHDANLPVPAGARLIAGIFGFVFAGIGLSVLAFMWLSPQHDLHTPPLFFRVFASFIAIPFVAIGGTLAYGAITGRSLLSRTPSTDSHATADGAAGSRPTNPMAGAYRCPRCGAPLGNEADVSPSGDVKCAFCNTWFNIHRPTA